MNYTKLILLCLLLIGSLPVSAEAPVPHVFQNGSVADADEMNANFAALVTAIELLQTRVDTLESLSNNASALSNVLEVTTDINGYPAIILTGMNLQVRSAPAGEEVIPGVGNIIVGNNLPNINIGAISFCSNPYETTKTSCEFSGAVWGTSAKTGFDNLVVGNGNSYTSKGGFVSGLNNVVTGLFGSVTGGTHNIASGTYSNVSGGANNKAIGDSSSINGGSRNSAVGLYSSVSGGRVNHALAESSSVNGGASNRAEGEVSSLSGGFNNKTTGRFSSVSGGATNTASGSFSSVSGGSFSYAIGDRSHIAGGKNNRAEGEYSVVGGGEKVTTSASSSWSVGELSQTGTGSSDGSATQTELENNDTAVGDRALELKDSYATSHNVAVGSQAMKGGVDSPSTSTTKHNVAVGRKSLESIKGGRYNVSVGSGSMAALSSGQGNVAVGYEALKALENLSVSNSGSDNIAIGRRAGSFLEIGTNNIYIGHPGSKDDVGRIQIGCAGESTDSCPGGFHSKTEIATPLRVNGNVSATTVTIRGGSDIAEPFKISGSDQIKAGMLVSIDPDQPGALRLTDRPYDRTIAGIISGAGGVNAGLILSQDGSVADGDHPVALAGRVYAWVDADESGEVNPGDLLTSSTTLGHAMKATNLTKAKSATLGKALTGLKSGKGLVLVLVSTH